MPPSKKLSIGAKAGPKTVAKPQAKGQRVQRLARPAAAPATNSEEPVGNSEAAKNRSGAPAARRRIVTAEEIESEFRNSNTTIGKHVKAQALFHEPAVDVAVVDLCPGAEFSETNAFSSQLLYYVTGAEDGTVEFKQQGRAVQRLSTEGEAVVDYGKKYSIRNTSTGVHARIVAVVPQSS
mmetsp:Transcript_761/g.1613  ORF Transcript_761/g.1613 Transcript_761/m.1613 type:complete len:180 (-) Transcript_761:106-645(-)